MPLKRHPVWALQGPAKTSVRPESWGVRVDVNNLATSGVTKMYVYGEIGYWGVEAVDVIEALRDISGPVEVHINSMGGSVFEGLAIYQAFVEHSAPVHMVIDGLAASAASFIAMAGDTIEIGQAAHMMIHNASAVCIGTAEDMEASAIMLRQCSAAIAGLYAKRSGKPLDSFTAAMDAETWYVGQEAVDAGLADKIRGDEDEAPELPEQAAARARQTINLAQLPDPPVMHSPDKIEDEPQRERPIETDGNGPIPQNSSPGEDEPQDMWGWLLDKAIEKAGGTESLLDWSLDDVQSAGLFEHLPERSG